MTRHAASPGPDGRCIACRRAIRLVASTVYGGAHWAHVPRPRVTTTSGATR